VGVKDLAGIARRLRKHSTDTERHLWRHLRDRQIDGFKFRRQQPLTLPLSPKGRGEITFDNTSIAEGREFMIQSRQRRDWIIRNLPPCTPCLRGEPDFKRGECHSKSPMNSM